MNCIAYVKRRVLIPFFVLIMTWAATASAQIFHLVGEDGSQSLLVLSDSAAQWIVDYGGAPRLFYGKTVDDVFSGSVSGDEMTRRMSGRANTNEAALELMLADATATFEADLKKLIAIFTLEGVIPISAEYKMFSAKAEAQAYSDQLKAY